MKVKLRIRKKGAALYEGAHDVIDEDSFAAAFAGVWQAVRQRRLDATTSVGELMEVLNDEVLDELQGAEISIEKAET
ncbi:MAG: hypothetical protein K8F92_05975 [Hyphomicrobium sp.]|uniref:hypothetical protein n=1 Tax=Hyphomicrobium sp. TaxID=82 RepID=UPI001327E88B|nr:hypothetical protein [Hyphomicrobium sp.]KAB2943187.1 MAG: hypothetical protein F9K20_04020 [Hyphomicrobium sp.]MBZ0209183.1 hypothetical protein [Hyphomicrobium sp.]MCZ7594119.1 hypothetical protein [Hyphomicrobium sp.]